MSVHYASGWEFSQQVMVHCMYVTNYPVFPALNIKNAGYDSFHNSFRSSCMWYVFGVLLLLWTLPVPGPSWPSL